MPDNKARHERAAVGTEAVSRDSARSPQSRDGRVRFEPGGIRPNTEPGPAPRPLIADVAAGIQPQPAKPAKVVAVNSDGQPAHDASIESGENKGEGAQEAGNVAVEQEPIELTPEELAAIVVCLCCRIFSIRRVVWKVFWGCHQFTPRLTFGRVLYCSRRKRFGRIEKTECAGSWKFLSFPVGSVGGLVSRWHRTDMQAVHLVPFVAQLFLFVFDWRASSIAKFICCRLAGRGSVLLDPENVTSDAKIAFRWAFAS